MKKLFEDDLVIVELNEDIHAVIVTNKQSDMRDVQVSVRAFDDGHLTILSQCRYVPKVGGFEIWL